MSLQPQTKKSIKSLAGKVSLMAMLVVAGVMTPPRAYADATEIPTGGEFASGKGTINPVSSNQLDIKQDTQNGKINWQSFNCSSDCTVNFIQPNSSSWTGNYVYSKGADPSKINGRITANGNIAIFDRNGVIFGKDSVINVGGIIASAGDMDFDKLTSQNKIDITEMGDGAIVNEGNITVADAGLVAFVGKTVVNNGVINAKLGKVSLAAGDKATIDLYGDGLVEIATDSTLEKAIVSNSGTINAQGGTVKLTASAAKDAVDSVVNMDGIVDVSSVEIKGGKIILGGGNSTVKVSGKLKANGKTGGGKIDVKGKNIEVTKSAEIAANAVETGNGGTVDLIATNSMVFEGLITAQGGTSSGNGGNVEVSGYETLSYNGLTDLRSVNGDMGSLLLDPRFMVIYSGALPVGGLVQDNVISSGSLALQLLFGNVILQADEFIDVGTKSGNYNINFGNAFVNAIANGLLNGLPDNGINASNVLGTTTAGNLTLQSDIVNLNRNLTLGNGSLTVDANTLNLNAAVSNRSGALLGDSMLVGTSKVGTINVGTNGKINQGIGFADDSSALTTINVAAGLYNETVLLNKSNVELKGANAGKAGNDATRGAATVIDPNSPGIHVTADNVIVDGFNVVGTSGADGYGVWVDNADNVTVRNNVIAGTSTDGIYANDSVGLSVLRNSISNVASVGNDSGSGIYLYNSTGTIGGATASDANVISNTAWDGIKVRNGLGTIISNNSISNVARTGVYASFVGNFTASGNVINGTGEKGISILSSTGVTLNGNKIDSTSSEGIRVQGGAGALQVTGNTIGYGADNAFGGGDDTIIGFDGIRVTNINNAVVTGNKVAGATRNGIYASHGNNATVSGNTVDNTLNTGIYLYQSLNSDIANNDIGLGAGSTIKGDGIFIESSANAEVIGNDIANTVTGAAETGSGIRLLGSNGSLVNDNTVANASWDGINVTGTDNIEVQRNVITNVDRAGIYAKWTPNILINENTINGAGDIGIYSINSNGGLIEITDNNVDNTGLDGIRINSAADGIISGNNIGLLAGSTIGRDGIRVTSANGTDISGNDVANAGRNGIYASYSDGVVIEDNGVSDTGNIGIHLLENTGSSIIDNIIADTMGDGINVTGSDNIDVTGNTVTAATRAGIYSIWTPNILVDNNIVNGTGDIGIYSVNSNGGLIQFTNNFVDNTGLDGIRINSASNGIISGNEIGLLAGSVIGRDGIRVTSANNTQISTNDVAGTKRHGIYSSYSNAVEIDGNDVNNSGNAGIYLLQSTDTDVTNNDVGTRSGSTISGDGIFIESSSGATIVGNDIANTITPVGLTIGSGIRVLNSDGALVNDNSLFNIAWDGINATNSDNVEISVNEIDGVGRVGIYATASDNTSVLNNTIANADLYGVRMLNVGGISLIDGNTIDAIGIDGVSIQGAANLLVQNNLVGLGLDGTAGTADDSTIARDGIRATSALFASILDNLVANASRYGVYLGLGSANSATVSGNEVANSDTGMFFESGTIDLTGAGNTLTGGSIGYHFEPTGLNSVNLVGNTIGSTVFNGQSDYYVELANGALFNPGTPTVIDGLGASYDGYLPNIDGVIMSTDQFDAIESKIFHFTDDPTLGLFFFGSTPLIDQADLFRQIAEVPGVAGRFNITIRGLPRIAGLTVPNAPAGNTGFSLNDITPAAGDDEQETLASQNPQAIEPAAGGANENVVEATSWNSAIDAASQGQVVNYSFSGDGSDIMSSGL